jgi:hypothetical protein
MADQPSPRRRFQFRLRTLMIVVTLLAVIWGTVALTGPAIVLYGGKAMVNVWWLVATFAELLVVNNLVRAQ